MNRFALLPAHTPQAAAEAARAPGAAFLAGGTDLLQLMKDGVETPDRLVDIAALPVDEVTVGPRGLRLGALARMAEVAAHPAVQGNARAVSEALLSAASPQVRNMGTVGGNLLQRTRCGYFRNTGFPCNKRAPGSGCPAIAGENRLLAILGGSAHCIATHPSDMPVALVAFDAELETLAPGGAQRHIPVADFYRLPGDTPQIETALAPGEIITAVLIPPIPAARASRYVKVRDRASFEFALVSVAAGLEIVDGTIRDARVAAGGVGTRPWRLPQVEAALRGRPAQPGAFQDAAALAAEGSRPASRNGFKVKLLQATVLRALRAAAA